MLGDDALACLKDIKRWLRLYDEKLRRLDVARCLAEANLVKGDLLEILASWPEDEEDDKIRAKITLACRMDMLLCVDSEAYETSRTVGAAHMAGREERASGDGESLPAYAIPTACTDWI